MIAGLAVVAAMLAAKPATPALARRKPPVEAAHLQMQPPVRAADGSITMKGRASCPSRVPGARPPSVRVATTAHAGEAWRLVAGVEATDGCRGPFELRLPAPPAGTAPPTAMIALLVAGDMPRWSQPLDIETLTGAALASAGPAPLIRPAARPREPAALIRVDGVGTATVEEGRGPPYPVHLQEEVHGVARKPAGMHICLAVTPSASETTWIMDAPAAGRESFHGVATFGRRGMDEHVLFDVVAHVCSLRLRPGPYSPLALEAARRARLITASSPPVRVLRTESPFDERTDIRVQIDSFGGRKVDETEETVVRSTGTLVGSLLGRPPAPGERVSAFAQVVGTLGWRLLGGTDPRDPRSYELAAAIGKSGQRVALRTVVSRGPISSLDADSDRIVARSRIVMLLVQDPMFEIIAVGGRRPASVDDASAAVPAVQAFASVRGIAAPIGAERVLGVYVARASGGRANWRLAGKTRVRAGASAWETSSIAAGEPGDDLLVTVVASDKLPTEIDDLGLQQFESARPVRVRVR